MVTHAINQTLTSDTVFSYASLLPEYVMRGNVVAIIFSLVLFFISLIIVHTLSKFLLAFLKRTILFMIVILVMIDFFPKYFVMVQEQGFTASIVLMGLGSLFASVLGLYIAGKALFSSALIHIGKLSNRLKHGNNDEYVAEKAMELRKEVELEKSIVKKQQESLNSIFSKESIQNEKSVLSVLVYLIVAEFGVFSSPTLSAPNTQVGIMFFVIFLLGVLVFTKTSYKNFKTAGMYFGVSFVVGLTLAILLGILWGKNSLQELLSLAFFTSDSLVAMITGMGVSLFAGSKG